MANISILPLTFVLTAVADRTTEAMSVTPPCGGNGSLAEILHVILMITDSVSVGRYCY